MGSALLKPKSRDKSALIPPQANEPICFTDLTCEAIIEIFKCLDLPNQLNFRVNKKLDKLQKCVPNTVDLIAIDFGFSNHIELISTYEHYARRLSDSLHIDDGLRRLAFNTQAREITISTSGIPNEEQSRLLFELFNFKADVLTIRDHGLLWFNARLPQVTIYRLLTIAQNVRTVQIHPICTLITPQDLCVIHKAMLEDACKMESLCLSVEHGMELAFLEVCFGLTIEESTRGVKSRATADTVEIYSTTGQDLTIIQGDVETIIYRSWMPENVIRISKIDVGSKPDQSLRIIPEYES